MLTDVGALGLAIFVSKLSERKSDHYRTYGYMRTEIIGAFINGATLVAICGFILWEAWGRIDSQSEILGGPMLIIAVSGLVANLASARVLSSHRKDSLNVEGAYLHLIFDALGSVGAILSGLVILVWGWYPVDLFASLFIVLLILVGTRNLLRQSINMLLDSVPDNVNYNKVKKALTEQEHVKSVHDLHIWSIHQGKPALSVHIKLSDDCTSSHHWSACLEKTRIMLKEQYNIEHSTIQIEPEGFKEDHSCG